MYDIKNHKNQIEHHTNPIMLKTRKPIGLKSVFFQLRIEGIRNKCAGIKLVMQAIQFPMYRLQCI